MTGYHIEPVDRTYNREMLAILRDSPITTKDLTLCFDRQPDFFRLAETKYHPHHYFGWFRQRSLRGFGMIGYHPAFVNGRAETVFHLKDYYVLPDARGKGFGYRLTPFLFSAPHDGARLGYAVLMSGNKASHRYVGRRNPAFPHIPHSQIVAQFDARVVFLTWPVRAASGYSIRPAGPEDIPAIVELLNREHQERLFGNVYQAEAFLAYLRSRPGLGLTDYRLAFDRNGRLAGVCAAWDCSAVKQTRVLRYGRRFFAARCAHRILATLLRVSPLPAVGECFKEITVADYAVVDRKPEIMNALLRAVYIEYKNRGYQNLIWGSSAGDPLLSAASGFFQQRVLSDVVLIATNGALLEPGVIRRHLPYVDLPCL